MRENRTSGSEGRDKGITLIPHPYSSPVFQTGAQEWSYFKARAFRRGGGARAGRAGPPG